MDQSAKIVEMLERSAVERKQDKIEFLAIQKNFQDEMLARQSQAVGAVRAEVSKVRMEMEESRNYFERRLSAEIDEMRAKLQKLGGISYLAGQETPPTSTRIALQSSGLNTVQLEHQPSNPLSENAVNLSLSNTSNPFLKRTQDYPSNASNPFLERTLIYPIPDNPNVTLNPFLLNSQPIAASENRETTVNPFVLESPPVPSLGSPKVNLKIRPSPFDGTTLWKEYHTQFEIIAVANGWDSPTKAIYLASMLRGPSLTVFQNLSSEARQDYSSLVAALNLRFLEESCYDLSHANLRYRVQKPKEDLATFGADVVKLSRAAFNDCPVHAQDRIALMQFMDGIDDGELQDLVRMTQPKTLAEALTKAIEFKASRLTTRSNRRVIRTVDAEPVVNLEEHQHRLNRNEPWGRRRQRRNRYDPPARDSPAAAADIKSGKRASVRLEGLNLTRTSEEASNIVINSCQTTFSGLLVPALINGVPCRMTVDTGANASLINEELWSKSQNGCTLRPSMVILRSVTGKQTTVLGTSELILAIGRQTFKHTFLIASIPDECILGMDFLSLHKCVLDLGEASMLMNHECIKLRDDLHYVPKKYCNNVVAAHLLEQGEKKELRQPSKPSAPLVMSDLLVEVFREACQNLDQSQQKQLEQLLKSYHDVFSNGSENSGRTMWVRHKIDIGNHQPIRQPHRRLPLSRMSEAEEIVQRMLQQGVIRPSKSPWASPVVLVQKKDGSTRFCIDYRRLNECTLKDSFPIPRIYDTLDAVAGANWFSTLDLKSGYWQVELDEKDKEKTAFTTGTGLYEFNVMPFGLCNAPATFERLMMRVLTDLSGKTCMVYLDDTIVFGKSFEEQMANLKKVLQRFREANLKLNPAKCHLFQKRVKYLGHIISGNGVEADPDKTLTIREWAIPKDKHELRSFLGLCTYYRKFVNSFSTLAKPLHELTEEKRQFLWTDGCNSAFEKLKQVLTTAPVLASPRMEGTFILDTDASNVGVGAVLSQVQDDAEKVIAYYSKTLSKPERNYCTTRKELLAVLKAVENFHPYLYGRRVTIRTDHAALHWLLSFRNPEGQIARWLEKLQQYNLNIVHRAGKIHGNADALSRRPCHAELCDHCDRMDAKECEARRTQIISTEFDLDVLKEKQQEDDELKLIIEWVRSQRQPEWEQVSPSNRRLKSYWALWKSLVLQDEVLHRRWESNDSKVIKLQPIIPRSLVPMILRMYHDSPFAGHFGINKTLNKIKERFFWIGCREDVEEWCRKCDTCAAKKGPSKRTQGQLKLYLVGEPFERIAIDILGPLPLTHRGNKYILVVSDYFTRWPEAIALPNQTAETVADALIEHVISRFGVPRELHSDQGRNFESEVFSRVMDLLGIKKTRTTALHPQSDGLVERLNRTILQNLSKFIESDQSNWDNLLPLFLMAYRSSVQESSGQTPAAMMCGHEMSLPMELVRGSVPETTTGQLDYLEKLRTKMKLTHEFARQHLKLAAGRMKRRYDVKANKPSIAVNSSVWLYNPQRRVGRSPKLQSDWEGPYRVIDQITDITYRIQRTPRTKPRVVHVDRLAQYQGNNFSAWATGAIASRRGVMLQT